VAAGGIWTKQTKRSAATATWYSGTAMSRSARCRHHRSRQCVSHGDCDREHRRRDRDPNSPKNGRVLKVFAVLLFTTFSAYCGVAAVWPEMRCCG